jgi:hypothetical protein
MLVVFFSLSMPTMGQIKSSVKSKIFITGAVYDSETKEPLNNARFTLHHSENYSTQSNGKFSLYGQPGDTISYRYIGYKEMHVIIPDTLKQLEYLMGVFMPKDTILIPEIVIFPRIDIYPSMVKQVALNEKMINQAQKNVNKAAIQGLTQPVKKYDADMNTRKTLREYQMEAQNKGLLVTPENSVGLSTNSYQTHYLQFGSKLVKSRKITNEMVRQSEIDLILANHRIAKVDTAKVQPKP